MAKKRVKGTKAGKPGQVVCFFFYGNIEDLGVELAKFVDESKLAAEFAETLANLATQKT